MSVTEADGSVLQPLTNVDIDTVFIVQNEGHDASGEFKENLQLKKELKAVAAEESMAKTTEITAPNPLVSELDNVLNIPSSAEAVASSVQIQVNDDSKLHATDVAVSATAEAANTSDVVGKQAISSIQEIVPEPKEAILEEQAIPVEKEGSSAEIAKVVESADPMPTPAAISSSPDVPSTSASDTATPKDSDKQVTAVVTEPTFQEPQVIEHEPIATPTDIPESALVESADPATMPETAPEAVSITEHASRASIPDTTITTVTETLPVETSSTDLATISATEPPTEAGPAETPEFGTSPSVTSTVEEVAAQPEEQAETLSVETTGVDDAPSAASVADVTEPAAAEVPVEVTPEPIDTVPVSSAISEEVPLPAPESTQSPEETPASNDSEVAEPIVEHPPASVTKITSSSEPTLINDDEVLAPSDVISNELPPPAPVEEVLPAVLETHSTDEQHAPSIEPSAEIVPTPEPGAEIVLAASAVAVGDMEVLPKVEELVVEEPVAEPAAGETVNNSVAQPVIEDHATEPVVIELAIPSAVEEHIPKSLAEEVPAELVLEEQVANPVVEEEQITVETTEEPVAPIAEDQVAEQVAVEEHPSAATVEEAVAEPVGDENTPSAAEENPESAVEGQVAEPTSVEEHPSTYEVESLAEPAEEAVAKPVVEVMQPEVEDKVTESVVPSTQAAHISGSAEPAVAIEAAPADVLPESLQDLVLADATPVGEAAIEEPAVPVVPEVSASEEQPTPSTEETVQSVVIPSGVNPAASEEVAPPNEEPTPILPTDVTTSVAERPLSESVAAQDLEDTEIIADTSSFGAGADEAPVIVEENIASVPQTESAIVLEDAQVPVAATKEPAIVEPNVDATAVSEVKPVGTEATAPVVAVSNDSAEEPVVTKEAVPETTLASTEVEETPALEPVATLQEEVESAESAPVVEELTTLAVVDQNPIDSGDGPVVSVAPEVASVANEQVLDSKPVVPQDEPENVEVIPSVVAPAPASEDVIEQKRDILEEAEVAAAVEEVTLTHAPADENVEAAINESVSATASEVAGEEEIAPPVEDTHEVEHVEELAVHEDSPAFEANPAAEVTEEDTTGNDVAEEIPIEEQIEELVVQSSPAPVVEAHEEIAPVPEAHPVEQIEEPAVVQDEIQSPTDTAPVVDDTILQEDTAAPSAEITIVETTAAALVVAAIADEVSTEEPVAPQEEEIVTEAMIEGPIDVSSVTVDTAEIHVESVAEDVETVTDDQAELLNDAPKLETTEENDALAVGGDIERPKSPWASFQVTTVGRGSPEDQAAETHLTTADVEESQAVEQPSIFVPATIDVTDEPTILPPDLYIDKSSLNETAETEGPLEAPIEEHPRSWTPSYSVHSQGSPRPDVVELEAETQEPPARPWTPSYSVHSQGSPLPIQATLDEETTPLAEEAAETPEEEAGELEDMKFAANEDAPVPATSGSSVEEVRSSEPPVFELVNTITSTVVTEETTETEPSVEVDTESVNVEQDAPTSQIDDHVVPVEHALAEESDVIGAISDDAVPTLEIEVPQLVLDTSEQVATSAPDVDQTPGGLVPDVEERPVSPSWVPSYSISVQGSPAHERSNPLEDTIAATEANVIEPEDVKAESLPEPAAVDHIEVPVIETEKVVESEDLDVLDASTRAIDISTAEENIAETTIPTTVPSVSVDNVEDVSTVDGVSHALLPEADNREPPKSPWTPSYSVTTQGTTSVSEEAELNELEPLSQPAQSTEIEDAPSQDALDSKPEECVPSVAVEAADVVVNTVGEAFPGIQNVAEEPKKSKSSSLRLSTLDENTTADGPLASPDAVSPVATRSRLESTASSRFFPGGWFSPSKTVDETRASLEIAQGEFTAAKIAAANNPSIDEGPLVDEATFPAVELAVNEEPQSASSEEKRRWCVIM
ncbi:hypothetical protein C0991_012372 [Blastosporella zonata]|nr:hypothetical protein C0991_012372 [Blastosporella zonata]